MKKIIVCVLLVSVMFVCSPRADAFILNVTSDIHIGKSKKRNYSSDGWENIIYPKQADKYFKRFLKNDGDVFLTLGDNTNSGKEWKKSKNLAKSVKKYSNGRPVLFAYGNHDSNRGFSYLYDKKVYSFDKENWRIIVLNTEEEGKMSASQLNWFREQLETDRKVVVAMHEPPFSQDLETPLGGAFSEFLDIVYSSDNVKYVLMGHYHVFINKQIEKRGIKFIFVQSLTLKGNKGGYLRLELE